MGQIKNIKLHIVTDIKSKVSIMLRILLWCYLVTYGYSKPLREGSHNEQHHTTNSDKQQQQQTQIQTDGTKKHSVQLSMHVGDKVEIDCQDTGDCLPVKKSTNTDSKINCQDGGDCTPVKKSIK